MTHQPHTRHVPKFVVTQNFTPLVNRYEIRAMEASEEPGKLLAFAQQKRLALRETVTFYADAEQTNPLFSFRAGNVMDLAATYTITDDQCFILGTFQKRFRRSLVRSSFRLVTGDVRASGQERNLAIALIRRFSEIPLPVHFDFVDDLTGQLSLSSHRSWSFRDRYVVDVPDNRVDFRVAAAMVVGLDALLDR